MSIPQLMIVLLWILRVVVAELLKEGVKALLKLWSKRSKRKGRIYLFYRHRP